MLFFQVRAFDKDQGAAGTVEYSLYEGDIASGVANQFGISASSGEIYLIQSAENLRKICTFKIFKSFLMRK